MLKINGLEDLSKEEIKEVQEISGVAVERYKQLFDPFDKLLRDNKVVHVDVSL